MNTKEILTIIALVSLGLCLLCSLTKAVMKGDKGKKHCDKAGGAFVFVAIVLLAVSQLMGEEEKYESPDDECPQCKCWAPSFWPGTGCDVKCGARDDCKAPDPGNGGGKLPDGGSGKCCYR